MPATDSNELLKQAKKVLKANDRGGWTMPAGDLYPHQWLWDSCFTAIGLRHINIKRAQTEIRSLLRGQWSNGMLPHIIFLADGNSDHELWRSHVSPYAPKNLATTGITQPPVLAEAIVQIGKKLSITERRSWYKEVYPDLLRYHQWLYRERDPKNEGLVVLFHPYECGLDSTPPWIYELHKNGLPWWVRLVEILKLGFIIDLVRRDTRHVPKEQRISNIDALGYFAALLRLRRKAYNSEALLKKPRFTLQDLSFNCILIRANQLLEQIATDIGTTLPEGLAKSIKQSRQELEQLWSEPDGQYFSRSFNRTRLVKEPSIASLLPLYAGSISQSRAEQLIGSLKNKDSFGLDWPVPSVPRSSANFSPMRYWQGPTWVNTNWLIIEGLNQYGFYNEAEKLRQQTIKMVGGSGLYEYFNPLTGEPAGAKNFSWTAALTIDLLKT